MVLEIRLINCQFIFVIEVCFIESRVCILCSSVSACAVIRVNVSRMLLTSIMLLHCVRVLLQRVVLQIAIPLNLLLV